MEDFISSYFRVALFNSDKRSICNRLVMLGHKKSVIWLLDRLDKTIAVDWDVKLKNNGCSNAVFKSKKNVNDQELIQSSTIPVAGYQMEK